MGSNGLVPSGKRLQKTMARSTMLLIGKSTISTGPFSRANCKRLPEGLFHVDDAELG